MHKLVLGLLVVAALVTYRWNADETDGGSPDVVAWTTGLSDRIGASVETRQAETQLASPALWIASDADTEVYLFGTIHVLPQDVEWMTPAIGAALYGSDYVWLEAVDLEDAELTLDFLGATGFDPKDTLSRHVAPREMAEIVETLLPLGYSLHDIEAMQPWLAAQVVAAAPYSAAGIDVGVDFEIERRAEAMGIPVAGLESFTEHMRYLTDMPLHMQVAMLRDALYEATSMSGLYAMVAAWQNGNLFQLEIAAAPDSLSGDLYDWLVGNRNENWVELIVAMLAEPGTHFVAVGVGHFTGPRSLQRLLEDRGVGVLRIE